MRRAPLLLVPMCPLLAAMLAGSGCVVRDIRDGMVLSNENLSRIDTRLRSVDEKLGSVQTELGTLQTRLDDTRADLASLRDELGGTNERLAAVQRELSDTNVHLGCVRQTIHRLDESVPFLNLAEPGDAGTAEVPTQE
jgi:septal ring factor EnvC (AmiA/AmiB activator)